MFPGGRFLGFRIRSTPGFILAPAPQAEEHEIAIAHSQAEEVRSSCLHSQAEEG
jgi:hypothetical protein